MKNLNRILTLLLVLSFVGFVETAYLTISHYQNIIPPCTTGGCEIVLTSSYSVIAGLPTALWGLFYYVGIFILVSVFKKNGNPKRAVLLLEIVGAGFVGSLILLYLQLAVIHAICLYCMGSFAINLLLVIFVSILVKNRNAWLPVGSST